MLSKICHAEQNIHLVSAYFRIKWNKIISHWTKEYASIQEIVPLFHTLHNDFIAEIVQDSNIPTVHIHTITKFSMKPLEQVNINIDFFLYLQENYEIPALHQPPLVCLDKRTYKNMDLLHIEQIELTNFSEDDYRVDSNNILFTIHALSTLSLHV